MLRATQSRATPTRAPRLRAALRALTGVWLAAVALAVALLAAAQDGGEEAAAEAAAAPRQGEVLHLRLDSIIHPVAAEFLADAIAEADRTHAAALVVELSTPGGLLTSTREIFTAMLGAETPVVVYVSPSGAQAASAGFFILMAADVAAMAPGTNTGAAHPVGGQGEDIEGTMGEKVEQDSAATIRSLADRQGRNAEAAEAAVVESRSYTADEALAAGLVDLVSPSLPALLAEIDGREVAKDGARVRLATAQAPLREVEMSSLRRVLSALAHPNIAYLLLSLGVLGLYFELMNPGAILPGVLGAIFLVLAFYGLSVLPVNYAGVALVVLAIVFFIAEIKVPSFGMLTVGGVVSLVLGGMMLFKSPVPALRVSIPMLATVAVCAALIAGTLMWLVVRAHRNKVTTGREGLIGERGRVVATIAPRGKVFVHGEYWNAVSAAPLERGAEVEVAAVDGMTLTVRARSSTDNVH